MHARTQVRTNTRSLLHILALDRISSGLCAEQLRGARFCGGRAHLAHYLFKLRPDRPRGVPGRVRQTGARRERPRSKVGGAAEACNCLSALGWALLSSRPSHKISFATCAARTFLHARSCVHPISCSRVHSFCCKHTGPSPPFEVPSPPLEVPSETFILHHASLTVGVASRAAIAVACRCSQPRAQAVCEWLEGDEAAMSDAEARMKKLVASWLVWLRCRSVEALPALRIDMLVRRTAPGRARLHTLELTELGFSMLAWESGPKEVFGALVRSCFDDVRCAQPQCACHTMCTHAVVPVANGGEGPARKRRRKRSKGGRPAEEAAAAPPSSEAKEPSTPGQ
eukprot:6212494-Pleurochrysis_carterae.AAC.1